MEGLGEIITTWVLGVFGNHIWLATMVISMIPLTEVKLAIPFATARGYTFWQALSFAMAGGAIITIFLTFFFGFILKLLKKTKLFKTMAISIEKRVQEKTQKIDNNVENKIQTETDKKRKTIKKFWFKYLSVIAFVAVPIPLTGVWMGTCIAVCLGLKYYQTISSVLIGNFIASLIITSVSKLIDPGIVLIFMLGVVIVIILYFLIRFIIKSVNSKKESTKIESNEKTEGEKN